MLSADLSMELESIGFPEPLPTELADVLHVPCRAEVTGQRSEHGGHMSQVKGQGPRTGDQESEVRGQRLLTRDQRSQVRGHRSPARGQRSWIRGSQSVSHKTKVRNAILLRTSDS